MYFIFNQNLTREEEKRKRKEKLSEVKRNTLKANPKRIDLRLPKDDAIKAVELCCYYIYLFDFCIRDERNTRLCFARLLFFEAPDPRKTEFHLGPDNAER